MGNITTDWKQTKSTSDLPVVSARFDEGSSFGKDKFDSSTGGVPAGRLQPAHMGSQSYTPEKQDIP